MSYDFVSGMILAVICVLIGGIAVGLIVLHRSAPEPPERGNPFIEPDPVPGIVAGLDAEWEALNR